MAKKAQKKASAATSTAVPLSQPDRSGPPPSSKTLFQLAEERGLLDPRLNPENYSSKLPKDAVPVRPPVADEDISRLGNSVLWSTSMAMLHFTFDVLTSHQYAETIVWSDLLIRAAQAFLIITLLFYTLHPFHAPPRLIPRLPALLTQAIFFAMSLFAGCYLIQITNVYSYYYVLKQAPPLGVLWIWSTMELDLSWALWSVGLCIVFGKSNGYTITGSE